MFGGEVMGARGPLPGPFSVSAAKRKRGRGRPPGPPPTKPDFVVADPVASDFWDRHQAELVKQGRLCAGFEISFGLVAMAFSIYRQISETIERDGLMVPGPKGRLVAHPLTRARNNSLRDFLDGAAKFGLTPASDARLPRVEPPAAGDGWEVLKGGREGA